jgi:hypothetical protein
MISERIQSPQAREIAMNKILLATATLALVAGAAPLSAQQANEGKISRALIVSGDFRDLRLPP